MARLTDHTRVLVATAYALGDLDELRALALAAIDATHSFVGTFGRGLTLLPGRRVAELEHVVEGERDRAAGVPRAEALRDWQARGTGAVGGLRADRPRGGLGSQLLSEPGQLLGPLPPRRRGTEPLDKVLQLALLVGRAARELGLRLLLERELGRIGRGQQPLRDRTGAGRHSSGAPGRNRPRAALLPQHATPLAAVRAAKLPPSCSVVVVPRGTPQGKPRACNYGLE